MAERFDGRELFLLAYLLWKQSGSDSSGTVIHLTPACPTDPL